MIYMIDEQQTFKNISKMIKSGVVGVLLARAGVSHNYFTAPEVMPKVCSEEGEQAQAYIKSMAEAIDNIGDPYTTIMKMKLQGKIDMMVGAELGYQITQTMQLKKRAYVLFAEALAAINPSLDLRTTKGQQK